MVVWWWQEASPMHAEHNRDRGDQLVTRAQHRGVCRRNDVEGGGSDDDMVVWWWQ
jgi:hypothetical protein